MLARPTCRVRVVTVTDGVDRTSSTASIANSTTAAVKPAGRLMGAKTRMPADAIPTATTQIHAPGHSFSAKTTVSSGADGLRAGTAALDSGMPTSLVASRG